MSHQCCHHGTAIVTIYPVRVLETCCQVATDNYGLWVPIHVTQYGRHFHVIVTDQLPTLIALFNIALFNYWQNSYLLKHMPTTHVHMYIPVLWQLSRRVWLSQLVSWSLTFPFSTNMAISETKSQGWWAIPTQWRKAREILTSTLAAFLFSSHPKRERDREAHLNYYTSAYNRGRELSHRKTKLNQIQQNTRINLN